MKKEKGISLIALIITIIVIIILAAIVIGGVFNTPTDAKFSRWCDEIGRLQDAVMSAHGSRMAQVATDVNYDRIDNSRIYKYIATKTETPSDAYLTTFGKKELVKIDKSNNTLNIEIPNYDAQDWYIDLQSGEIYMLPGFSHEGEMYMCQADIKAGGGESGTPIDTTGAVSYVGCYADIDGNGSIDGIIYADLLARRPEGDWVNSNGTYSLPTNVTSDNVKDYVISQTGVTDERFEKSGVDLSTYVKGNVIRPAKESSGEERFYVMGLNDIKTSANGNPTWYANANGKMSPLITSDVFGKGKENTEKMIAKWNAAGTEDGYTDAAQDARDVWQYITTGWFLPSRGELAAFAKAFNISNTSTDATYYGNYGLGNYYWSSSQYNGNVAWLARFNNGCMYGYSVDSPLCVRLSTTF